MKTYFIFLILFLAGIILHLGPTNAYSSFLITLKTGRTIYAEDYRIEGEHIIVHFKSGILKIFKNEVQSIFEEKGEIKEEREEIREDKKDGHKNLETDIPGKDLVLKKEQIEYYKKKKLEMSERIKEAKKTYFNTTDKSDKDRARKIMISISGEFFALEEEVITKNNGRLPEWWKE
jgi:hypothetical protein